MSSFNISIAYLPDSVRNKLSRKAILTYNVIAGLLNLKGGEITYEYATVTPSLGYLAKRTELSRHQVSRAITELKTAGLIKLRQMRTASGEWRTNVIGIGCTVKSLWKAYQDRKKGRKEAGLQKSANIMNLEASEDNYYKEFVQFLKNMGGRGMRPAPS